MPAQPKRPAAALVSYGTSDDDENETDIPVSSVAEPPPKKRKLPPLSATIVPPGPVDNPALHQGRIRTTPHAEGQFSAHVYVSLGLTRGSPMHKLVHAILADARAAIPTLHEIWAPESDPARHELHLSLSRPISLRAHQREDLKRAVKNIAKTHKAFTASFATLSELINDEKTRTFLTMELGAGYQQMSALADALAPTLQAIRQQIYYVKPRFHASIGWALLHGAASAGQRRELPASTSLGGQQLHSDSICTSSKSTGAEAQLDAASRTMTPVQTPTPTDAYAFPTIECLPTADLERLNSRYGAQLAAPKLAFDVNCLTLKIGKDVYSWKLIDG